MFFKKEYIFYLPKLNKYRTVKAKNEAEAVYKLINFYKGRIEDIENYEIFFTRLV